MPILKLSEFFKIPIKPFLYGAFLSRIQQTNIDGKPYFYAYSMFQSSKYIYPADFSFHGYASRFVEKLNLHSGYENWQVHHVTQKSMELRFYILNDLNISTENFYIMLYQNLHNCDWAYSEQINPEQKSFIRGFMELRGSVDTNRPLIAQDYFFNNRIDIKKAMILIDQMHLPMEYTNFNARNLQPQFVSGENRRNPQLRINLNYYAKEIGFINDYKAKIFETCYDQHNKTEENGIIYFNVPLPNPRNYEARFIDYLNFFTNNIYQKQLTTSAIRELRQHMGFDEQQRSSSRNQDIVHLFNKIAPDKCAICGTTKTFENKKTGKQYFEVHHVISFRNNQELDNLANLVKLCPTCHNMLKKGKAPKEKQIKAIIKILHEHNEIYEFASSFLGINDINEMSEEIYNRLG